MIEEPSPINRYDILQKALSERPIKQDFVSEKELITLMFENRFEIFRVEHRTLQKISQIDLMPQTAKAIDFTWSPDSTYICYSSSNPKVYCYNIGDPSLEKRTITLFNDCKTRVSQLRWFDSANYIQNDYDCFKPMEVPDKDRKAPAVSFLESCMKCSYSHFYSVGDGLKKIQAMEHLLNQKQKIAIVSGIDSEMIFRMSFNGALDFIKFPLKDFIESIADIKGLKYEFSPDFSHLHFMYLRADGVQELARPSFRLEQMTLNTSTISVYFKECFFATFLLQMTKEVLANCRFNYFRSKEAFDEVKKAVEVFFGENQLTDYALLSELCGLIKFGKDSDTFLKFFENFDLKKLHTLSETINNNLNIALDVYLECVYPSLQRVSAYWQDLRNLQVFFEVRKLLFLDASKIASLEKELNVMLKVMRNLIDAITNKKIELKNFCLFCFKWKVKASSSMKNNESPEFKYYNEAVVDYELLLKFLSSSRSIYLEDIIGTIYDQAVGTIESENSLPLHLNDKELELEQETLERELEISIDKTNVSPKNPITKTNRELFQSISNFTIQSIIDTFLKGVAAKISLKHRVTLLSGLHEEFQFSFHRNKDETIGINLMADSRVIQLVFNDEYFVCRKPVSLGFLNSNSFHSFSLIVPKSQVAVIDTVPEMNNYRVFISKLPEEEGARDSIKIKIEQSNNALLIPLLKEPGVQIMNPDSKGHLGIKEYTDFKSNNKNLLSYLSEGKLAIIPI